MRFALNRKYLESLPPAKRAAVEARIAKLRQAYSDNPLYRFHPHLRQAEFMASRDPAKLFIGGNRSGKTTCGIVDDLIQAVDMSALPPWLRRYKHWDGRFHCRIIVPDFQQTLEGVVLEKIREWCPKHQFAGGSFDEAYDKLRHMLWFANGNWFQFMTFEQQLDKFQGAALDRVHYDEEPPERIRRENLMRLIDRDGQEMLTMTPLSGMTWVFETHYEPWEKHCEEQGHEDASVELTDVNDDGAIYRRRLTVVTVDMDDNPHLNSEAKHRVLDDPNMSAEERQARKSGRFISFAGLVFGGSFRKDLNVIPEQVPPLIDPETGVQDPRTGVPKGAYVYCGIDPGLRHMAAVLWLWMEPDGRTVIFDELGIQGKTIAEVCAQIHLKNAEWKVQPRWTVIDPASRNKVAQTGRSDQEEYFQHGVVTIPGQNSVTLGINRVKAWLENAHKREAGVMVNHIDTPISLYVSARCVTLLEQFKRYRWAAPSRSEDDSKERPVKRDDHLLDALRYIVMSSPYLPEKPFTRNPLSPLEQLVRDDMARASQEATFSHPNGPGVFQ